VAFFVLRDQTTDFPPVDHSSSDGALVTVESTPEASRKSIAAIGVFKGFRICFVRLFAIVRQLPRGTYFLSDTAWR